jgi:hypothetical protein
VGHKAHLHALEKKNIYFAYFLGLAAASGDAERRAQQGFENHLFSRYQRNAVYSPFNQLTRLLEQEILLNSVAVEALDYAYLARAPLFRDVA